VQCCQQTQPACMLAACHLCTTCRCRQTMVQNSSLQERLCECVLAPSNMQLTGSVSHLSCLKKVV
jgi:hypothetical protein